MVDGTLVRRNLGFDVAVTIVMGVDELVFI